MRHGQPRSVRSQIDMPQPGELVFIACHDGKIRDAHVRRKVRKRAWNSWWNSESNRRLKARSSRPLKQCQTRFRIRNEHTTTCTAVSPRRESFVSLSPLQPVIESLGDEAGSIMDYFHHRFRQNSTAVNVENDWIAFTLSDTASRHAQIALIALNSELDSGAPVQRLTLKHTATAVKLVRAKLLLQGTAEMPNDFMVGAVALLVIIESMQGDRASSEVHFHGLNNIVAARGGFHAFTGMHTLQRIIAWALRSYWLRWQNHLALPKIRHANSHELEAPSKMRRSRDLADSRSTISEELLDVLACFRITAAFPGPTERTKADRRRISQSIYDVEYRLILLHQEGFQMRDDARHEPADAASQLVRNAAQIYVFIALRQMLGRSRIVQRYSRNLESQLHQHWSCLSDTMKHSFECRDLLIWTVVLLLLTTYESESHLAIARCLIPLLEAAKIVDLEQLIRLLKSIAWMDDMLQGELMSLWHKLSELKV